MVSERNRIIELVNYIESQGVEVNIAKNKARGNKGYFKTDGKTYRIDIAKNQSEDLVLKTLAHEFAHFVHYSYDKTLKSLDFIFDNLDEVEDELLSITVDMIPKSSIEPFFNLKDSLKSEISVLSEKLAGYNFDDLERTIKKTSLKYLLKHDRVKVFEGLSFKFYSIEDLKNNNSMDIYLTLKSKRRALKRVNSKICRLNKYYNAPTELFARSFELYVSDKKRLKTIAPLVYDRYEQLNAKTSKSLLIGFINIIASN